MRCRHTRRRFRRAPLSVMTREDNLVAGRAGAANKNKKKKPSAKTLKAYEYAAAAAEKKAVAAEAAAAEAKEGALGANAIEAAVAAEAVAATACEARARATKARARLTAASAPSVAAAAADARRAIARRALDARIAGSVQHVDPSSADLEALAEAEAELTVEQVALQEMREQGRGWVCALWVGERLHVYLAGDLAGENPVIRKVVVGGGKEGAQVRMDVDKDHRPRRSRRTRMRRRSAATVRGSCWDSMLLRMRKWWR